MAKAKPLTLSFEDRSRLETITKTRTLQAQTVTRARILLLKADGESIDAIAEKVGLNRNSVLLCLKKYNQGGIENAIYDAPGRGRNAENHHLPKNANVQEYMYATAYEALLGYLYLTKQTQRLQEILKISVD